MNYTCTIPEMISRIPALVAGDQLLLSGVMYTARDAAHERLIELMRRGAQLPVELSGSVIYYCGPCPAKPGDAIGSCGPTTSSRMDIFTPDLLARGVKAVIGKGPRNAAVRASLAEHGAVYLAATGGVAALLAQKVRKSSVVAFEDLGPEAIYRLEVLDFPVVVAIDSHGTDLFARFCK